MYWVLYHVKKVQLFNQVFSFEHKPAAIFGGTQEGMIDAVKIANSLNADLPLRSDEFYVISEKEESLDQLLNL